jgi:hypothetical protein
MLVRVLRGKERQGEQTWRRRRDHLQENKLLIILESRNEWEWNSMMKGLIMRAMTSQITIFTLRYFMKKRSLREWDDVMGMDRRFKMTRWLTGVHQDSSLPPFLLRSCHSRSEQAEGWTKKCKLVVQPEVIVIMKSSDDIQFFEPLSIQQCVHYSRTKLRKSTSYSYVQKEWQVLQQHQDRLPSDETPRKQLSHSFCTWL